MSSSDRLSGNEEAQLEIQKFLEALNSYPARFARNPGVSFAQHHSALTPVKRNGSGRTGRNGSDARKS